MIVEPQVFLIGESTVNKEGLSAFLIHLGAPELGAPEWSFLP